MGYKIYNFAPVKGILFSLFALIISLFASLTSIAQTSTDKSDQLFQAVRKSQVPLVKAFLDQNADPNYIKATGPWMKTNLLITAVNKENLEVVKLLVLHKADINWKDGFNTSALMYAGTKGNKEIFLYLLENGADIHATDGHGNTVLSAAREGGNKELIALVEEKLK